MPSIDLFPVNKIFCKFDISGDTKHPIHTNKHAVLNGASNVFEIITVDIDVPVDLQYAPTLTVYIYDNVMGIIGERLVGVANIPLLEYCQKVLTQLSAVTSVFKGNLKSNTQSMLAPYVS